MGAETTPGDAGAARPDSIESFLCSSHEPAAWRDWLQASFVFVCIYSREGRLVAANAAALAAAGVRDEEVIGRPISEIDALSHSPAALGRAQELMERAARGETIRTSIEVRLRGGRLARVDCLICPLRDASGQVIEIATAAVDTAPPARESALARTSRELRMVSGCTQTLVRAQSEAALLQGVCRTMVESGGYLMVWVGFALEDPERTIHPVAFAGHDQGYLERTAFSWADDARGGGPTGRAVRERVAQVCRDIASDPALASWATEASRRGYRSSAALPLIAAERCLGVLNIYSGALDAFDTAEIALLKELAADLAYGLAALRAHQEREQAQRRVQRFRSLLDRTSDLIYICDAHSGRILDANEAVSRRLGYSRAELLGMTFAQISLAAAQRPWTEWMHELSEARSLVIADQHRSRAGALIPMEIGLQYAEQDHQPYAIAVTRDITERTRQQQRIARLARLLRMQSSISAAVLHIRDRDELLREACRIATRVGGYDRAVYSVVDADGRRARPQFRAGDAEDFPEPAELPIGDGTEPDTTLSGLALRTGELVVCSDLTRSQPPVAMRDELLARGYQSLVALPLIVEGRRLGVLTLTSKDANLVRDEELVLLQDMRASLSAALRSQEQAVAAQFLAYFDPLTGLAKRSLFCERLEGTLRGRSGTLDSPAVAVFDVHHLSSINDSFGRHFGDLVLQRVAERLKTNARSDELIGYLGGGTFALIEPQLGADEGAVTALLEGIFGEPLAIEGRSLRLSYRLGVAHYPLDGSQGDVLVQRAEAALKHAKESGEPYLHYRLDMHSQIAERLDLEHRLRTALDEEQFELHYQAQLDVASGRIDSLEALLRWKDPQRGLIAPDRFLPTLEASGLIVPVGQWVLARALGDCEQWAREGLPPLRVAVNVSALQLRRKTFVPAVLEISRRFLALPGWGLDIEITESVVLHDQEGTSRKLRELRSAGVRIALDDFGTGYSALGLLTKLPVDLVKIDRSFILGLPNDVTSRLLVDSIVRLAGSLHLISVAEGVETPEQLQTLREMGCRCWQGYLHGAAVPREKVPGLLRPR